MTRDKGNDKGNDKGVAESFSFEEALSELEKIISAMEQGEVSLAESVKYYERAMMLHKKCVAELQNAKLKIEQLVLSPDSDKNIIGKKDFAADKE
ncbi:MAG: exodeoxyribonuclease VII small subunit [Hydrotalea sp.]|nr:exodeoxyribonuclease VII small subunit [Hydrotalea sp.]